jgi:hypothetical protein
LEQFRRFENRRADLLIMVSLKHIPDMRFDILPFFNFTGQYICRPSRSVNRHALHCLSIIHCQIKNPPPLTNLFRQGREIDSPAVPPLLDIRVPLSQSDNADIASHPTGQTCSRTETPILLFGIDSPGCHSLHHPRNDLNHVISSLSGVILQVLFPIIKCSVWDLMLQITLHTEATLVKRIIRIRPILPLDLWLRGSIPGPAGVFCPSARQTPERFPRTLLVPAGWQTAPCALRFRRSTW